MPIECLNLYAGIGGNRKLWPVTVRVTAVEIEPDIAEAYQKLFPEDEVVIDDAHEFLLEHYKDFDFIWASPPCQTHSGTNNFLHHQGVVRYPDLKLYEEIIFLKQWFDGKWVVENVKPYYEPLIKPQYAGRHAFWANFMITPLKIDWDVGTMNRAASQMAQDRAKKSQVERNCVNPKLGLHVFDCAFKVRQETLNGD